MTDRRPLQLLMHRPHLDNIPPAPGIPAGYALRAFTDADDEGALGATLAAAFDDAWPLDRVRRELTDSVSVRAVYIVVHEGKAVATASSRAVPDQFPGSGYVHWVATHPDHARRGLGLALMVRVLQDFVERGDSDAILETDDLRLPAIRTYLRCGFIPIAHRGEEDHRRRWSEIVQRLFEA